MSLPKGYKRLEYIQSSGTQFIETNVPVKSTSGFLIDFASADTSSERGLIGGFNYGGLNNNFGQYGGQWVSQYGNNQSYFFGAVDTARHLVSQNVEQGAVFFDGTQILSGVSFYDNTARTFRLFCYNGGDSYPTFWIGSFKLYSCQIYDNETLIRDFIPCQNASGAVGLWDAVNEVFYGNAGTGTFTAGPVVPEQVDESEITELEYIQSSGTQYADTGYLPNQNSRVVCDIQLLAANSNYRGIFGVRDTVSDTAALQFIVWCYPSGQLRTDFFSTNKVFSVTNYLARMVIDKNKNVTVVDGVTTTNTEATGQCTKNMFLLCTNDGGTANYYTDANLYSCQIYDNGLLERDFIPAMLSNGEVGLYDRVFHEFYRNAGTGEFIAGPVMAHEDYTELEYIESDGNQYVDSGVELSAGLSAELDYQVTIATSNKWFFSVLNVSSMAGWRAGTFEGAFYFTDFTASQTTDLTARTLFFGAATKSYALNVYLFAENRDGTAYGYSAGKLYSCEISTTNKQIRNFVAMLHPSGVAGLWDSVNERFYASATTTDFLAGPEAQTVPKAPSNFRVESETDTLVTLAWDTSEDVLGYRLYRQGQLLADTTETSVSVTVEPFAGAVFTLTAYNENGEGAGTSLTHYSIPENPLLYLITDRTAQDVAERNPKGYYAASDLNRVGYAMDYLADIIRAYGYKLEVDTKTDWTDEDWKLTGEMVKYLQSLNNLKAVFSTLVELPESMEKIDHEDANNIELLLLTIDETIARVVAGFTRSNAFALYSGQRSLPVSQSDRGRNWGQLDAMNTSWANWQLATWYLLLYGNLKAEGVVE